MGQQDDIPSVGHRRPKWGRSSRTPEQQDVLDRHRERQDEERLQRQDEALEDPFYRPPGYGRIDE
jgi:hypothetical protein